MTNSDQSQGNLAALLCALSFATGLGLDERMEHGINSAYIGLRLADVLNLPSDEREAIFYGALLKDVGCTSCAAGFAAFFPMMKWCLARSSSWSIPPISTIAS